MIATASVLEYVVAAFILLIAGVILTTAWPQRTIDSLPSWLLGAGLLCVSAYVALCAYQTPLALMRHGYFSYGVLAMSNPMADWFLLCGSALLLTAFIIYEWRSGYMTRQWLVFSLRGLVGLPTDESPKNKRANSASDGDQVHGPRH